MQNLISIEDVFEKKNIRDGVLICPSNIRFLTSEFGDRVKKLNIKKIVFSNDCNLKAVEISAFKDNEFLESIDFSNCGALKKIGDFAFFGCKKLKEIEFGDRASVHHIGDYSFYNSGIQKIDLSNSHLAEVGNFAFGECAELKELDFHNCVFLFKLGKNIVSGCALNTINLSDCDGIINLKENFFNCEKLQVSGKLNAYNATTFKKLCGDKCKVSIYDGGREIFAFSCDDEKYSCMRVLSTDKFCFGEAIGLGNPALTNVLSFENEFSVASQNRGEMKVLICELMKRGASKVDAYSFLAKLGYFGITSQEVFTHQKFRDRYFQLKYMPQNLSKAEITRYKYLLAKDLMRHKITKNIISEQNKANITNLIVQKTNQIARNYSVTQLVGEFIKNNVLPHKDCGKLLNILGTAENSRYIKLLFAEFFVANFSEIMDRKVSKDIAKVSKLAQSYFGVQGEITLNQIYDNFEEILSSSNKKVVNRQSKQRFTLLDCEFANVYEGVEEKDLPLAELCGFAKIKQEEFDELKKVNDIARRIADKQVLKVEKDCAGKDGVITYEFIDKNNPLGFVLGNITNCCQCYGEIGHSCMINGMTDPNSGFVVFKRDDKILAQAWVWYSAEQKAVAIDNIEAPDIFKKELQDNLKTELCECVDRLCRGFVGAMQKTNKEITRVVIGRGLTGVGLGNFYPQENDKDKEVRCDRLFNGTKCYSDIQKVGQYVAYKNGNFLRNTHQNDNVETMNK